MSVCLCVFKGVFKKERDDKKRDNKREKATDTATAKREITRYKHKDFSLLQITRSITILFNCQFKVVLALQITGPTHETIISVVIRPPWYRFWRTTRR